MAVGLFAGILAAVGAGCGNASHGSGPALPLDAYLVEGNEETGFQRTAAPKASATAAQWTALIPDAHAEPARLMTEGFRSAVSVQTGSTGGEGVSWVMELGSPRNAAREQTAELESFLNVPGPVGRFKVPGVITADGFTYPGPSPQDANALFREGRCLLLIGDQASATSYSASVIAAVRAISKRTDGHSGSCAT